MSIQLAEATQLQHLRDTMRENDAIVRSATAANQFYPSEEGLSEAVAVGFTAFHTHGIPTPHGLEARITPSETALNTILVEQMENLERFLKAIVDQNVDAVTTWLESHQDDELRKEAINKTDQNDRTPLHMATLASSPEIVGLLLNAGARKTPALVDGRNALHIAAARGSTEVVKLLLQNNQRQGQEGTSERQIEGERSHKHEQGGRSKRLKQSEEGQAQTSKKARRKKESARRTKNTAIQDNYLDVNMPDTSGMTPLHYAIINGHADTVCTLVSDFGADITRSLHDNYKPEHIREDIEAIQRAKDSSNDLSRDSPNFTPLVLVVHIEDKERRENMLRTLLRLGVSPAQVDASGVSSLLRIVQIADLDLLKIIFEENEASALSEARKLLKSGAKIQLTWSYHHCRATNALIMAILEQDQHKAMFLLEQGVQSEISFEEYSSIWNRKARPSVKFYHKNFPQPAELALNECLADVFVRLIENGVDPSNSVTTFQVFNGGYDGLSQAKRKMTYLDLIHQKIEYFRKESEGELTGYPKLLSPTYYPDGTYERWLVESINLSETRKRHSDFYSHHGYSRQTPDLDSSVREKRKLRALYHRYTELADWLISRGGRTYAQVQAGEAEGDAKGEPTQIKGLHNPQSDSVIEAAWESRLLAAKDALSLSSSFLYPDAKDESSRVAYHELFKAAWNGDYGTIRKYTKGGWDGNYATPPLSVYGKNQVQINVLSVATKRPHSQEFFDFLKAIAQTDPRQDQDKATGFNPREGDGSVLMDKPYNESGISIEEYIRGDNVGALEDLLKMKGLSAIGMRFDNRRYDFYAPNQSESVGKVDRPIGLWAAHYGSLKIYDWLETDGPEQALREYQQKLEVEVKAEKIVKEAEDAEQDIDDAPYISDGSDGYGSDFDEIYKNELIARTRDANQQINAKTKRNQRYHRPAPPVLSSHPAVAIETENERLLKVLSKAGSTDIRNWMGVDHHQLIHAVITNYWKRWGIDRSDDEKIERYENNIRYFLSKGSQSLEFDDNALHLTPLFVAASMRNKCAMKALLNLGANANPCKPKYGFGYTYNGHRNLAAAIICAKSKEEVPTDSVEECLAVLPSDIKIPFPSLFRAESQSRTCTKDKCPNLGLLLRVSTAENLRTRDSGGNLPIHGFLGYSNTGHIRDILNVSPPETIIAESREGLTPLEIADVRRHSHILGSRYPAMKYVGVKHVDYRYIHHSQNCWGYTSKDWPWYHRLPGPVPGIVATATKEAVQKIGKQRILISAKEFSEYLQSESRQSIMAPNLQKMIKHGYACARDSAFAAGNSPDIPFEQGPHGFKSGYETDFVSKVANFKTKWSYM
ncbi:hypothetical protein TWF281_011609 [Arthrobotrys megalospora]